MCILNMNKREKSKHIHKERGTERGTKRRIETGIAANYVEKTRKRKQVAMNRRKTLQYP